MVKRRRPDRLVVAVAALAAAGCSYGSSSRDRTLTLDAAKQRMDGLTAQVTAAMPVKPRLEPNGGLNSTPCDGGLAGSPTNVREEPGVSYFLRDIPAARNTEIFDSVKAYAGQHGFKPYSHMNGFASYQDGDGFSIGITASSDGTILSLIVGGPCIWPNGTPPPKS